MSVESEIAILTSNMQNAYTAVDNKGGTLPQAQNMDNLATAIESIPSGTPTLVTKSITVNGTYNASSDNADGYSSVTVNVSSSETDYATILTIENTIKGTSYVQAEVEAQASHNISYFLYGLANS